METIPNEIHLRIDYFINQLDYVKKDIADYDHTLNNLVKGCKKYEDKHSNSKNTHGQILFQRTIAKYNIRINRVKNHLDWLNRQKTKYERKLKNLESQLKNN